MKTKLIFSKAIAWVLAVTMLMSTMPLIAMSSEDGDYLTAGEFYQLLDFNQRMGVDPDDVYGFLLAFDTDDIDTVQGQLIFHEDGDEVLSVTFDVSTPGLEPIEGSYRMQYRQNSPIFDPNEYYTYYDLDIFCDGGSFALRVLALLDEDGEAIAYYNFQGGGGGDWNICDNCDNNIHCYGEYCNDCWCGYLNICDECRNDIHCYGEDCGDCPCGWGFDVDQTIDILKDVIALHTYSDDDGKAGFLAALREILVVIEDMWSPLDNEFWVYESNAEYYADAIAAILSETDSGSRLCAFAEGKEDKVTVFYAAEDIIMFALLDSNSTYGYKYDLDTISKSVSVRVSGLNFDDDFEWDSFDEVLALLKEAVEYGWDIDYYDCDYNGYGTGNIYLVLDMLNSGDWLYFEFAWVGDGSGKFPLMHVSIEGDYDPGFDLTALENRINLNGGNIYINLPDAIEVIYVNNVKVEDPTVSAIKSAIDTELAKANVSEVKVTGKFTEANSPLRFHIPQNKKVIWSADYSGSTDGATVSLHVNPGVGGTNTGTIEVTSDGYIINHGTGWGLDSSGFSGADNMIIIRGGTIKSGNAALSVSSRSRAIIFDGHIESSLSGQGAVNVDNGHLAIYGGKIENTSGGTNIRTLNAAVLYVAGNADIGTDRIIRGGTATAYYVGEDNAAKFATSGLLGLFTPGTNLHRLDNAPALTAGGSDYTYDPDNAHAGAVAAAFAAPTGFTVTNITASPDTALHTRSGSTVTFAGMYNHDNIKLNIAGTLAGGRIGVEFSTAEFGVNVEGILVNGKLVDYPTDVYEGAMVDNIQEAIQSQLDTSGVDTVTVTGGVTEIDAWLELNIPANKTVIWDAKYIGNGQSGGIMSLEGEGTMRIGPNAVIENDASYGISVNDSINVILNGGTLKSWENPISLYDDSTLIVLSGTVEEEIFVGDNAVIYIEDIDIADGKILRGYGSNATAYYIGDNAAKFKMGGSDGWNNANLFRLDDPSFGGYSHSTTEAHAGFVTMSFAAAFDIDSIAVNGLSSGQYKINADNTVTFGGQYDADDVSVTVSGSLANGRIPVEFTTPEFGLNLKLTPPTGEITIRNNSFKTFLNTITFGMFFKNTVDITITGEDMLGNDVKIELRFAPNSQTEQDLINSPSGMWYSYDKNTGAYVTPGAASDGIIYARLTDSHGNVSIISSNGFVVYAESTADKTDFEFYKNIDGDIETELDLGYNTFDKITLKGDRSSLKADDEYDFDPVTNTLTIYGDYLNSLDPDEYTFEVWYNPMDMTYVEGENNDKPVIEITVEVIEAIFVEGVEVTDPTVDKIQTAITNALAPAGATVKVTGSFSGADRQYGLYIAAGKTVIWDAYYSGTAGGSNLLRLSGEGRMEITENGYLYGEDGADQTIYINPSTFTLDIKGGTVESVSTSALASAIYADQGSLVNIYSGLVQNNSSSQSTISLPGNLAVYGGSIVNRANATTINLRDAGTVYIEGGTIRDDSIRRQSGATTATAYYKGESNAAKFTTSGTVSRFTPATDLFRIDNYVPLFSQIPITPYAGTVTALFTGITITSVTATPATALHTYSGDVVSFAGEYDEMVTLDIEGTIGGGKIPIEFTTPAFRINVTKAPTNVTVTPPDDIIYGDTLGDPSAVADAGGDTFTYHYKGTLANTPTNTPYNSDQKPTQPGSYTVTATLVSDTHYGENSASFVIDKKQLGWISGTVHSKPYDGSTLATIDTLPSLDGIVGNDNIIVYFDGDLFFSSSAVGTWVMNGMVSTFKPTVSTAEDIWKYFFRTFSPQSNFEQGTITPTYFAAKEGEHYTVTQLDDDGWTSGNFVVTAMPGYGVDLSPSEWYLRKSSLTWDDETDAGEAVFYVYVDEVSSGDVSAAVKLPYKIDKTDPTAQVQYRNNALRQFLNIVTVGLFFKDTVDVTIQAADSGSGVAKVEYYKADKEYTDERNITDWETGTTFTATAGEKFILYVRVTDKAGNISYYHDNIAVFTDVGALAYGGIFYKTDTGNLEIEYAMYGNAVYRVTLGDDEVYPSYYTAGYNKITFNNAYLKTLSNGQHTFMVYYYPLGVTVQPDNEISDKIGTTAINITIKDKPFVSCGPNCKGEDLCEEPCAKLPGADVPTPTLVRVTHDTIEVHPILTTETGQYVEYTFSTQNTVPDDRNWYTYVNFEGLMVEYREYYIWARSRENDTHSAGSPSGPLVVRTLDITPPTGTIWIRNSPFTTFLNTITFGLFFKDTVEVEIMAQDGGGSGVATIEYQIRTTPFTDFDEAINDTGWIEYDNDNKPMISAGQKGAVYALITDNVDLQTVITSSGVVVFTESKTDEDSYTYYTNATGDLVITLDLGDNDFDRLWAGNDLTEGTDYDFDPDTNTLTIYGDYLDRLKPDTYRFRAWYRPLGEKYENVVSEGDQPYIEIVFEVKEAVFVGGVEVTDPTSEDIQKAIQDQLDDENVTEVEVTGRFDNVTDMIQLWIPKGKTVIWDIEYIDTSLLYHLATVVIVNGEGTMIIGPNGVIETNKQYAVVAHGAIRLILDGGTVSSDLIALYMLNHTALTVLGGKASAAAAIAIAENAVVYVVDGSDLDYTSVQATPPVGDLAGYYIGDNDGVFVKGGDLEPGVNLFRLDGYQPDLGGYTYDPNTPHAGTVTATFPGITITDVTADPDTVLYGFEGNTVTFGGHYNHDDITLDITGTLAGGKIPVSFTTGLFGVNITIPYDIDYDLDGGIATGDNPVSYNITSDAITLSIPTKAGHVFKGWTGTGLDEPTMIVTIPTGSSGDRSYRATWSSEFVYDLTYLAAQPDNSQAIDGSHWQVSPDGIWIAADQVEADNLQITLHGNSGGRSVAVIGAAHITLEAGTVINSNSDSEPALSLTLALNQAITLHGKGDDIVISSNSNVNNDNGGIISYSDLIITGTLGDITTVRGDGIFAVGNITIDGNIGNISAGTGGEYGQGIFTPFGDITITESSAIGDISACLGGIRALKDINISGEIGDITATLYDGILTQDGSVTINGAKMGMISGGTWGSGIYVDNGTFTLSGNAVVYASSVVKSDGGGYVPMQPTSDSQGILFVGDDGTVYGNVTLQGDLTIEDGQTLTVLSGSSLTVPNGVTLTNDGEITNNGSITGGGGFVNNGAIDCSSGGIAITLTGLYKANYIGDIDWPTGLTAYVGQSVADVNLSGIAAPIGEFVWMSPTDTVGSRGDRQHEMRLFWNNYGNYNLVTNDVTVAVYDNIPPTGTITIRNNSFTTFLNTITFGLFFKDTVDIEITGEDIHSGVAVIEYYLSPEELPDTTDWDNIAWESGESCKIDTNRKVIVYARITDNEGNVTVINSDGVVVFTDSAAVTTELTYTKFSDDDRTAEVKLNGNTIAGIANGTEILLQDTDYTVSGETITFAADYLDGLAAETHTLTVSYNPMGESYVDGDAIGTTEITVTITMAAVIPETSDPPETSTDQQDPPESTTPDTPKTGDDSRIILWLWLGGISALTAIGLRRRSYRFIKK